MVSPDALRLAEYFCRSIQTPYPSSPSTDLKLASRSRGSSILTLAAVFWAIRVRWVRFRRARIDPTLEDIQDSFEAAGDAVHERRKGISRWAKTLRD